MRTDFARGSSRPAPVQIPTESQPWAPRHVVCIELRACTFLHISDPFRAIVATSLRHTARKRCSTIDSSHTPRTRMYVCMAEKGVGLGDKGGVKVRLNAHDPLGPHIHHLASTLRVRRPHSVEILATDGATIAPDDCTHTTLSSALHIRDTAF